MAIKIKNILWVLTTVMALSSSAQNSNELKVGDKLPDIFIKNIINQKENTLNLLTLHNNQLLLIDFWFTSCIPCLKEMRLLESLKAAHPNKFNVLMVTYQDSTEISRFLKRDSNRSLGTPNLFMATNDTLLKKMFPHKVAPHNIWVDNSGVIRAITGTDAVTKDAIMNFSNSFKAETKKDNFSFNPFTEFHAGDTSYSYRSIITPYIQKVDDATVISTGDARTGFNRFSGYNISLSLMYWQAYSGFVSGPRYNLMEVETTDSLRIFVPKTFKNMGPETKYKDYDSYKVNHLYNYSLTLPSKVPAAIIRDYIFEDLRRQFNISATIELKKRTCVVVTKVSGDRLPFPSGNAPAANGGLKGGKIIFKNAKIKDITDYLFRAFDKRRVPYPYAVDIDFKKDIAFDLELDFNDELNEKNQAISPEMYYRRLERYGFRFDIKLQDYPVLILKDHNP